MNAPQPNLGKASTFDPLATLERDTATDALNGAIVERDHYRRLYRAELDKAIERKELVKAHLANLAARALTPESNEAAFRAAELACERSYSDLVCSIEDTFCVDGETMVRALS